MDQKGEERVMKAKTKTKNLLCWFMALAITVAMTPATMFAAADEAHAGTANIPEYSGDKAVSITVNGAEMSGGGKVSLGDGYAAYDQSSGILTLKDATIAGNGTGIIAHGGGMIVKFQGNNTIGSGTGVAGNALATDSNDGSIEFTTPSTPGTLTLRSADNDAIATDGTGSIFMQKGTVKAYGGSNKDTKAAAAGEEDGIDCNDLVVSGGELSASVSCTNTDGGNITGSAINCNAGNEGSTDHIYVTGGILNANVKSGDESNADGSYNYCNNAIAGCGVDCTDIDVEGGAVNVDVECYGTSWTYTQSWAFAPSSTAGCGIDAANTANFTGGTVDVTSHAADDSSYSGRSAEVDDSIQAADLNISGSTVTNKTTAAADNAGKATVKDSVNAGTFNISSGKLSVNAEAGNEDPDIYAAGTTEYATEYATADNAIECSRYDQTGGKIDIQWKNAVAGKISTAVLVGDADGTAGEDMTVTDGGLYITSRNGGILITADSNLEQSGGTIIAANTIGNGISINRGDLNSKGGEIITVSSDDCGLEVSGDINVSSGGSIIGSSQAPAAQDSTIAGVHAGKNITVTNTEDAEKCSYLRGDTAAIIEKSFAQAGNYGVLAGNIITVGRYASQIEGRCKAAGPGGTDGKAAIAAAKIDDSESYVTLPVQGTIKANPYVSAYQSTFDKAGEKVADDSIIMGASMLIPDSTKAEPSAKADDIGTVTVSWSPVPQKGTESVENNYEVYRSTSKDSGFDKIGDVAATKDDPITFRDKNAAPATTYYYLIKAANCYVPGKGTEAIASGAAKVTTPAVDVVKITGITCPHHEKLKITWAKSKKASAYVIYRANKKTGKYVKVAQAGKTRSSWTGVKHKIGKVYYYKVAVIQKDPISGKSFLGAKSAAKGAKVLPCRDKVSLSENGTLVTAGWGKYICADGWQVSVNGKTHMLTRSHGSHYGFYGKHGKTYKVTVRTYHKVNGKKVWSRWSAVKKITLK
jgi:hypothetical protein